MSGLFECQESSGIKSVFFLSSSLTVSRARCARALACWNGFKWN